MKKLVFSLSVALMMVACTQTTEEASLPTIIHITEAGGVDDGSFNLSAWTGITQFYQDNQGDATHYKYIASPTLADLRPNLGIATDEGKTLVSVAGFNFIEDLQVVASQNPSQHYFHIDGPDYGLNNVKSAYFADDQSAFLAGALVALKSQEDGIENPVFGFIGGMDIEVIKRFEQGYLEGIQHILPNAQVLTYYTQDWVDPSKAKATTLTWINQYPSLYAVFSAAGPAGGGSIAQIKEARGYGRVVWAVGVDSDQYGEGMYEEGKSVVLTSTLKNANRAIYMVLDGLNKGQFEAGLSSFDLSNDGVGITFTNKNELSEQLLAQINQVREAYLQR
jgi:basic membrane protein A and related proteins